VRHVPLRLHVFTELAKHEGCGIYIRSSEHLHGMTPGGMHRLILIQTHRTIGTPGTVVHTHSGTVFPLKYFPRLISGPYFTLRKTAVFNKNKEIQCTA
jgi:hypothetical protein